MTEPCRQAVNIEESQQDRLNFSQSLKGQRGASEAGLAQTTVYFAISKSSANIPPGSLNCVISASYFAEEFIDCHDDALVKVFLRDWPLHRAKKSF